MRVMPTFDSFGFSDPDEEVSYRLRSRHAWAVFVFGEGGALAYDAPLVASRGEFLAQFPRARSMELALCRVFRVIQR
jgi:hypothetical protein